ncbi:MAG: GIY-YIG nuclease family protein [Candidatus Gottesmanbacteria bacterium]
MFYTYFLKSLKNGYIYIGSTSILPTIRTNQHNYGTNTWTKQNGPFELKYFETYICKEDARKRELFYKTGFGKQIKSLIVNLLEKKNVKPKIGM